MFLHSKQAKQSESWDAFPEVDYGWTTCPECFHSIDYMYWSGDYADFCRSRANALEDHTKVCIWGEIYDDLFMMETEDESLSEQLEEQKYQMEYPQKGINRNHRLKNLRPHTYRYA